jgi:predicted Rossmann fold flavoprotein
MRPDHAETVVIVGAGPAGLMAALSAAKSGARTIVFEQQAEAGSKLLATGGGRCNFTNTLAADDFIRRFGAKARFAAPALRAMDGGRLRLFFAELGVESHSPDGFHVFPASDSARSIRDALLQACEKMRVEFRYESRARGAQITRGKVSAVAVSGGTESADRIVLAAGGAGYPELGGGQTGYELARAAGHKIVPLCPALVPLVTREMWPASMAGVTLPRVVVKFPLKGGVAAADGGLLFTHRGLSGPAALDISGAVSSALLASASVDITLDLAPDMKSEDWQAHLERARAERGARTVLAALGFTMPAALARIVLDLARVPPDAKMAQLAREQGRRLVATLKNLPLTVTATEGFGKAMVTRGGVKLDEVNPKTLESRLAPGLFFAGEILDVDGPCGGFNLQWAFASGFLAGNIPVTKKTKESSEIKSKEMPHFLRFPLR